MLIKNMLDNRATGWEKSKKQNESGPMKVEDLRRQVEAKLRAEEELRMTAEREEQSYLGDGGQRDRRDGRGQKGGQYDR